MGSHLTIALIAAGTVLGTVWPALWLVKRALDQRAEAIGLVKSGYSQIATRSGGEQTRSSGEQTVSTQRPLGEETTIQRTEAEAKLAEHLQREYANQGRQILPGEAKAQAQLMLDSVVW